ncbi:MAG: hypothetical protein A2259_05100 [Candidatus Moranbacteria bacterium RIFOXYA2_FULL_43_15]|nr:MAG: hypothetical protein A2259_05100 [Candidatus Moranbacteria bacterium RIFOXYA2_FULL_43_15]
MYKVPDEYYCRLHHVRPRFKNDVESVLLYMATEISRIEPANKDNFNKTLNQVIKLYPGNASKTEKTINNWRTEISSLFGLIECEGDIIKPGRMALLLSENQDLIEFFRYFLFYFQYPGGHLKPQETAELIKKGIRFKPAKYLVQVFFEGQKIAGDKKFGITKAEATHCIFNDLRVTRDSRSPKETVEFILKNREAKTEYDQGGDITRYAGDIMDYMELADLVTLRPNYQYYLNNAHLETLHAFVNNVEYFQPYEEMYGKIRLSASDVAKSQDAWFAYVNEQLDSSIFEADVASIIGEMGEKAGMEKQSGFILELLKKIQKNTQREEKVKTKEIGDVGESMVIEHEKTRLTNLGRQDILHMIQKIPEKFAVGYDITSFDGINDLRRLIEVKTSISRGKLSSTNFHMTPSEWSAANSHRSIYFIYRLMISSQAVSLFLIQDPVGKYKADSLGMVIRDGADVKYSANSGNWEKLLV